MQSFWPPKDPNEVLDYAVDWTARLDGDTITASTFNVTAGSVVIRTGSPAFTDSVTRLWLIDGVVGEICKLINQITTAAGRVMEITIAIKIIQK